MTLYVYGERFIRVSTQLHVTSKLVLLGYFRARDSRQIDALFDTLVYRNSNNVFEVTQRRTGLSKCLQRDTLLYLLLNERDFFGKRDTLVHFLSFFVLNGIPLTEI